MENPKKYLVERILGFRKQRRFQWNYFYQGRSNHQNQDKNAENLRKGTEFESFVVRRFDQDYFTLIEWRSDKTVDSIFPLMSKFPDLEFYFESSTQQQYFAVECKWRDTLPNDILELDKFQVENYQHYQEVTETPTFLVIGIGNTPSNPNEVFIIPLSEISELRIHYFNLQVYRRKNPHDNFFLDCASGYLR